MKNILRLFVVVMVGFLAFNQVDAKPILKEGKIDSVVKNSAFDKTSTIAVSVKDAKSGNVIYEYNESKLLHPASTMKLFSAAAAIDSVGSDYKFKTQFFVDKNKNLYVKLGADPLLTSKDLKYLVKELRNHDCKKLNNVYIDDSIVDNADWGIGWMWDDETNYYMPKFSAYNLDGNVFKVNVGKNSTATSANVTVSPMYPIAIYNKVKVSNESKVSINRYNWQSPDVIEVEGFINSPVTLTLPVSNVKRYFLFKLDDYLSSNNIKHNNDQFEQRLTPLGCKLIGEVSHSSSMVLPMIFKNSNNLAAESFAKVAASNQYKSTGSAGLTTKMFKEFYSNNKVETDSIEIADMSGVSRNDLLSVDWMTSALSMLYRKDSFAYLQDNMAQPGDGTLTNRMLDLRGNAWLKTGSISNVSGITGYVLAKDGKMYAVSVLIQNFKAPQKDVKSFEDKIINAIYNL